MQKIENKTVYFRGDSGVYYPFTLYPLYEDLPDVGAVYIFTKVQAGSGYTPLFIGQTDTLATCIQNHEKWRKINEVCNAICIYFEEDEASRVRIEHGLLEQQCSKI